MSAETRRAPAHSRLSDDEWRRMDELARPLAEKDELDEHEQVLVELLSLLARLDHPPPGGEVGKVVVHPSAGVTPELLAYGLLERIRGGDVTGCVIITCGDDENGDPIVHEPSWYAPQLGWVSSMADVIKDHVLRRMRP